MQAIRKIANGILRPNIQYLLQELQSRDMFCLYMSYSALPEHLPASADMMFSSSKGNNR